MKIRHFLKQSGRYLGTICFIATALFVLSFTGCGESSKDSVTDEKGASDLTSEATSKDGITPTEAIPTLTPDLTPTEAAPTVTPIPAVSTPVYSDEKLDLKAFREFRECFIDYKFDVKSKKGLGDYIDSFDVNGKYDLDLDGKPDDIHLFLCGLGLRGTLDAKPYIEINGIRKDFYMDSSDDGEVVIFDLDKNDSYLELAYFDQGPSDDPIYECYRYDGKEIIEIGDIDPYALLDGYGRIIPSGYNTRWNFTPVICSGYKIIENNEFKTINLDIREDLGKTYEFSGKSTGGDVFFHPCDAIVDSSELSWDPDQMIYLDPCRIKIFDIEVTEQDRGLCFYYVELPDGRKGMLYFWMGD